MVVSMLVHCVNVYILCKFTYIYREKLKSEQKNREFLSSLEMKDRQIASLQSVSAGGYVYQYIWSAICVKIVCQFWM